MKISTAKKGQVCVVTPHVEKIDASIAVEFRTKLVELVEQGETLLALNLKEVEFIDSSGIGELVSSYVSVKNAGGKLRIASVPEKIMLILDYTSLGNIIEVPASPRSLSVAEAQALAAVTRGRLVMVVQNMPAGRLEQTIAQLEPTAAQLHVRNHPKR